MQKTFFTIVIPTRERSDTLMHTIATALAQDYENFAVLVSDNASTDRTKEVVDSFSDPRLRYVNTGQRVSMSENWEFALSFVSEGWVTVLGDDDGILAGSLSKVDEIIRKTGLKAVRSNGFSYDWPSLTDSSFGAMRVSKRKGLVVRNSGRMLDQVIQGRRHYTELPVLYNGGFVCCSLIEKAKEMSGKMFLSMTPDVYSAIVFSMLTDEYVYSHEPLAINGASAHSGGTAAFESSKRQRSYDPAEKFWSEPNIPFHASLPLIDGRRPVYSIPVFVYEAFFQAEAFHHLKDIVASRERLAAIVLNQTRADRYEVLDWVALFIRAQQLDSVRIAYFRGGLWASIFYKCRMIYVAFSELFFSFWLEGNRRVPLRNVYEASIAGGLIKELKPISFGGVKWYLRGRK